MVSDTNSWTVRCVALPAGIDPQLPIHGEGISKGLIELFSKLVDNEDMISSNFILGNCFYGDPIGLRRIITCSGY